MTDVHIWWSYSSELIGFVVKRIMYTFLVLRVFGRASPPPQKKVACIEIRGHILINVLHYADCRKCLVSWVSMEMLVFSVKFYNQRENQWINLVMVDLLLRLIVGTEAAVTLRISWQLLCRHSW
jgi:hypothetical protein